jgi:YidC/Oxa1 family membrane protein insertase
MLAFEPFQWLLNGLGTVMAEIYDLIPNWGLTIIVLTIMIRLILLPLGIKQIRSMQNMQAIQPMVKQIQQKYKQNKQKQQEEIMKLYREHGVNPFAGCWPVLLQFPILIAMYSVIRFPQHPVHIPKDSALYAQIEVQIPEVSSADEVPTEAGDPSGTQFLGMNLLCSASLAGNEDAKLGDQVTFEGDEEPTRLEYPVDCGNSIPDRIPYYFFAAAMFATTYLQQRQMQKASPPGAASQQQQQLMKIMPLVFGVFGVFFPSGLVLYWTTSNLWQIGQQYFMLQNRPTAETLAARADGKKKRGGMFASLMDRANEERNRRGTPGGSSGGSSPKPSSGGSSPGPRRSGGNGAGNRKKRPKR